MLLKSSWTSHLQIMNRLKPLVYNWTGRRKGTPKGVDETHPCILGAGFKKVVYTVTREAVLQFAFLCNDGRFVHKALNNNQICMFSTYSLYSAQ